MSFFFFFKNAISSPLPVTWCHSVRGLIQVPEGEGFCSLSSPFHRPVFPPWLVRTEVVWLSRKVGGGMVSTKGPLGIHGHYVPFSSFSKGSPSILPRLCKYQQTLGAICSSMLPAKPHFISGNEEKCMRAQTSIAIKGRESRCWTQRAAAPVPILTSISCSLWEEMCEDDINPEVTLLCPQALPTLALYLSQSITNPATGSARPSFN